MAAPALTPAAVVSSAPVASPAPAASPAPEPVRSPEPVFAPAETHAPTGAEPDYSADDGPAWDSDEPANWLDEEAPDGPLDDAPLADDTFLDDVNDDGWDDEFLDWEPPGAATIVESAENEPSETTAAPAETPLAHEPDSAPATAAPAAASPGAPMALGPTTSSTSPARPDAGVADVPSQPGPVVKAAFRPDLFSGGNLKPVARKKRSPRVRATPPTTDLDVPANVVSGELDQATRAALDAAVAIPRPVFIADLIETFGEEAVENWQEEHRRDGSVVRFLPAKARHRARGSLVVPVSHLRNAAGEFSRGVWAECMPVHTGARLFELGVVLHAYQDQVVTHQVHAHGNTVQLVLKQSRGTCGAVIMCAGNVAPDSPAAEALLTDIEALASQPMSLIVAASTSDPVFDDMCRLITEAAASRRWRLPCPIVGARSWEWASGNQAALRHLAG